MRTYLESLSLKERDFFPFSFQEKGSGDELEIMRSEVWFGVSLHGQDCLIHQKIRDRTLFCPYKRR